MLARSWPNWAGDTCVIVATGPSARGVPLDAAKGKVRVIAIKESWKLAPWCDVLYGCDKPWWIANHGVPSFRGLKFSPSPTVAKVYGATLVRLVPRAEILTGELGRIGCGLRTGGGHSGFHAINLAVQFGVRRIILVGFDMTLVNGDHWHPYAQGTRQRRDPKVMTESRIALDACSSQLSALGVEIINASAGSALVSYPKMDFLDAIGWQ